MAASGQMLNGLTSVVTHYENDARLQIPRRSHEEYLHYFRDVIGTLNGSPKTELQLAQLAALIQRINQVLPGRLGVFQYSPQTRIYTLEKSSAPSTPSYIQQVYPESKGAPSTPKIPAS